MPFMQTFLPFPSFEDSARSLDRLRLGKQRVEAWQVLRAISDPSYGWQNHPCVNMWRGHARALALYGLRVCEEWRARGYADSLAPRFAAVLGDGGAPEMPAWLGSHGFHASHRATLVRKDPAHYGPRFPDAEVSLPVSWPAP